MKKQPYIVIYEIIVNNGSIKGDWTERHSMLLVAKTPEQAYHIVNDGVHNRQIEIKQPFAGPYASILSFCITEVKPLTT